MGLKKASAPTAPDRSHPGPHSVGVAGIQQQTELGVLVEAPRRCSGIPHRRGAEGAGAVRRPLGCCRATRPGRQGHSHHRLAAENAPTGATCRQGAAGRWKLREFTNCRIEDLTNSISRSPKILQFGNSSILQWLRFTLLPPRFGSTGPSGIPAAAGSAVSCRGSARPSRPSGGPR
jgi:hypothetical protein